MVSKKIGTNKDDHSVEKITNREIEQIHEMLFHVAFQPKKT
jgi:hypothetical protein